MKYAIDILHTTPELILVGWFISYILTHEVNISFRIKNRLNIPPSYYVKWLDCCPCITWWITLAISFEPVTAMAAYLIATLIDKIES